MAANFHFIAEKKAKEKRKENHSRHWKYPLSSLTPTKTICEKWKKNYAHFIIVWQWYVIRKNLEENFLNFSTDNTVKLRHLLNSFFILSFYFIRSQLPTPSLRDTKQQSKVKKRGDSLCSSNKNNIFLAVPWWKFVSWTKWEKYLSETQPSANFYR